MSFGVGATVCDQLPWMGTGASCRQAGIVRKLDLGGGAIYLLLPKDYPESKIIAEPAYIFI